ncbi:Hypothetical predicted protein, partial [Pelobates cultripes]
MVSLSIKVLSPLRRVKSGMASGSLSIVPRGGSPVVLCWIGDPSWSAEMPSPAMRLTNSPCCSPPP